ncbi:MAG: hypothetical protein WCD81_07910 [Candidatus Bathyarchaeia archaeon]
MQLKYFVPFKAQEGVSAEFALREKLLNIEGLAIDTSVNANKWQVPEEDLDFFVSTLISAQLRIDHAESAMAVIGRVPESKRIGNTAWFRAEIGDLPIIEKVLRGYLTHVSVQVDSDQVECSKCMKPTRKEGMLVHLCPGAWEIVHKPKVRELSIVASPAYEKTVFAPVGFAAAMNESQKIEFPCAHCSQLLQSNEDVGSKRKLQEPENKKSETMEVKPLSDNAQAKGSPHQAQDAGIVNVSPGESAPQQVEYQQMMDQLTTLENKIKQTPSITDAESAAMTKRVADLEAEVAKRATKRALSKKITELSRKLTESAESAEVAGDGAGQDGQDGNGGDGDGQDGDGKQKAEAKRASGHGIVAVDEANKDILGNYAWFKDIMKASQKLKGMK